MKSKVSFLLFLVCFSSVVLKKHEKDMCDLAWDDQAPVKSHHWSPRGGAGWV